MQIWLLCNHDQEMPDKSGEICINHLEVVVFVASCPSWYSLTTEWIYLAIQN